MIKGRSLSESVVLQQIEGGFYARNIHDAIRKFGVNFIAVSPIYESCIKLLATNSDVQPHNIVEPNCIYVQAPY